MKTIKIKLLLLLIAVLGLTQMVSSQTTVFTTILTIVNNRPCPITVNWEVSDCYNCPSGILPSPPYCNYCNSNAVTGGPTATFVIGGGATYTVDISAQSVCSFYSNGTSPGFDVSVGLFEINGQMYGTFGNVSCGCSAVGYSCFSTSNGLSGTTSATGCSGSWSMSWTNPTSPGVLVTIN